MLTRVWNWSEKLLGLPGKISALPSAGFSSAYNEPLLTTILLNAALMRLPSLNAAELSMRNNPRAWRKLLGATRLPSADTLGRGLEKSHCDALRSILRQTNHNLRRAKAFDTRETSCGLMAAAVDGHETFATEKRCCPTCLTRKKTSPASRS